MKNIAQLEEELGQAADRMRAVQKAAKDQAAKLTPEPADPPRGSPGSVTPPPVPTIPTR